MQGCRKLQPYTKSMSSSAFSAVLQGLNPTIIEAEVDQTLGLPTLQIIGLATNAVVEAKQRIITALANQHLPISSKRTIVNLAPTDIKKSDPSLDLAIIIALLKKNKIIKTEVGNILFLGEIALDGRIKPVRGALPIAWKAKELGFNTVVIPHDNQSDLALITDVEIIPVRHLRQVMLYLKTNKKPRLQKKKIKPMQPPTTINTIVGHKIAKRALQIAAAGNHHLLFIGPPGSGKTKLAQSILNILPPLSKEEQLETAAIHSVTSVTSNRDKNRPFRAPHHTISDVSLLGGGLQLLPGEVSLAHNGVLFLDEFAEFNRRALEALRQPLTEKIVRITRAKGTVSYPANFMLIAASNPCPCGFYGSSFKQCRCTPSVRQRYMQKLSGPLLDRIDLVVWIEPQKEILKVDHLQEELIQVKRNPSLKIESISEIKTQLNSEAFQMLQIAIKNLKLSTRAVLKTAQVANTIHYLDQNPVKKITKAEVLEALQYRWKDQAT
jgi:magnesium chelatase family protein